MIISAITLKDAYKIDHRRQFPDGTTRIYSNMTARSSRNTDIDKVIYFGGQYFFRHYLREEFKRTFFDQPREYVLSRYKRRVDNMIGKDAVSVDHIGALHELQMLPLRIKTLPEGTLVPLQVPFVTIENTIPEFYWLTNFIETMMSATLWPMITSATTAFQYRKVFEWYARKTGADKDFIKWQGHDFSFRGMFGIEAAMMSGAAHLLSFTGTDTIPAIDFLEQWYWADSDDEIVGGSVPATEHAVMCAGEQGSEEETYRRLITQVYPKGIVSVVSDTWDFWKVVTEILPKLKHVIEAREGKLVIRPDSGDPAQILCGTTYVGGETPQEKGLIETLWEIFGGTVNERGYKVLNPKIGAIYGDSITLARQDDILSGLEARGFASSNVVLGIGSFTYQYTTRDVFGQAIKATYAEVNSEPRLLQKAPKTDSSKNSHRGLIAVQRNVDGELEAVYPVTRAEEAKSLLQTVFENGQVINQTTLGNIRALIEAQLPAEIEAM